MNGRGLTIALMLLAVIAPLRADDLRENEIIIVGGAVKADDHWLSGMNLCLRQGQPGVMYCMVQHPGQGKVHAYLLLIKGDEPRRTFAKYGGAAQIVGDVLSDNHFVDINGSRIDVVYEVRIMPDPKSPPVEKLTINGKDLALSKGRVVLVDLSAPQPKWRQVAHDLPPVAAPPKTIAEIDAAARSWTQRLRKEYRVVDEYLRPQPLSKSQ